MILLRVPLSLSPPFISLRATPIPLLLHPFGFPLLLLFFIRFFRPLNSFVPFIHLLFNGLWLSVRFHRSLTLCVFSVSFSWSSVDSLLHFLFRASKLFFVEILEIHFSPLYALSSFFVYFEFSICWIFNKILRVLSFTFSRFFHIVLSLRYLL